ncbi:MAG: nucleoside phosphorylase [Anaerolineales bacterium]|jgi:uridine phosphorylase
MTFHLPCDPKDISRYVFCPGDQRRAKKIADHFDSPYLVVENRGYVVYSGWYEGVFLTVIGTGMGGPAVAIALEELARMGADTFIRVGSCGVFQEYQKPGDVIIASGTVREGGTANAYLPLHFPAVPTFNMVYALVQAADKLNIPITVGVGVAGDAFYHPAGETLRTLYKKAGLVAIEMESDTLFILGQYHGWRTAAIFTSDGTPTEIKPEWGMKDYFQGEENAIRIALLAMKETAQKDTLSHSKNTK